jgi:peptidoglycan hydrolase CwlO-like protein
VPSINPDVLKQTLEHFAEQEALVEAEIKQSEEQIVELEARIVECHERLKTVELDRDHVMEIMTRYASKSTTGEAKAPAKAEKAEAKPAAAKAQPAQTGTAKPIKEPPKAASKTPPAAAEEKKAEEAAEGDDDTVKNINDALRGLFR